MTWHFGIVNQDGDKSVHEEFLFILLVFNGFENFNKYVE